MTKNIAIILSGCGVYDGSEIYETTLTLLHLDKAGASYQCFAPNVPQAHVTDYQTGEVDENDSRNVLAESARLARGEIKDIAEANPADIDAIIFPGGFGAAKNLSNFAFEDNPEKIKVEEATARLVQEGFAAGIPFGFICITPACVAAKALEGKGLTLTIGDDKATAKQIEALGHTHINTTVRETVRDQNNPVVSTAAYMLGQNLAEVEEGISKLVREVLDMAQSRDRKSA